VVAPLGCRTIEQSVSQSDEIVTDISRQALGKLRGCEQVSLVDRRINDTYPGISSNPFVQEGGPSLLDHRRSGSRHAQTSYCIACTNARRSPGDRSPLSRPESPSHPLALMYGSYNGVRSTSTLPSILPYRSRLPWTFNDNGDLVHLQPHPLDQHRFVDSQCFDQITGDD
jgi:hypothetical protein